MTRQEAIKILWQYDVNFEPHPTEDVMHAIDMAIEALEQKPDKESSPLDKQAKWIPVSEKLPDTHDDMLVTDGENMAVGSYRDDANAWENYNFGWLENLSEPPHGIKTVIAWMPLPEQYKEKKWGSNTE